MAYTLTEGWRNALSSRVMGLLLTALSVITFAGVATADAVSVAQLAADQAAWVSAGGDILVVSNESWLSALDCERLNRAQGVHAAVGIARYDYRASLANAPDANLSVVGTTAGLAGFLTQRPEPQGAVVSPRIAEQYGLNGQRWISLVLSATNTSSRADSVEASSLQALDGPVPVTVTDLAILGEQYASGVVVSSPTGGLVSECMVWAEPGAKETLRQSLPDILPGAGGKPTTVADRLIVGEFSRDYLAEYENRPWRWVPLATGAALGLIWILIRWVRRSEDGLYQSLGVTRLHRVAIRVSEWSCYTYLGALVAVGLAYLVAGLISPGTGQLGLLILRSIAISAATSMMVALIASLLPARNPLEALKDR